MPVAGPQTIDVLNYLEKDNNKYKDIKVIGVDTNQVELYSNHKNVEDRFITSALKNLKNAITEALTVWNKNDPTEIKKWFSGTTVNAEQEWIGIASSKNFKETNINNLIKELTPELNALSNWWRNEIVAKNPENTFATYNDGESIKKLINSFNEINKVEEK